MADKRIEKLEQDEDGWWLYLANGYCNASDPGCHQYHENTKAEVLRAHSLYTEPCYCKGCLVPA